MRAQKQATASMHGWNLNQRTQATIYTGKSLFINSLNFTQAFLLTTFHATYRHNISRSTIHFNVIMLSRLSRNAIFTCSGSPCRDKLTTHDPIFGF
jgi:hypothetical protein